MAVAADWWRTASWDSGGSAWQQLQELATDAARLQGEMARGYSAAARAAVGRDGPSSGELLKSLAGQFEDYVREVGRLNLAYARGLQDLATTSSERLQDLVTGAPVPDGEHSRSKTTVRRAGPAGDRAAALPPHAVSPPHAALALEGPIGGTASGVFTVANPREESVRLSFDAGLLSDRSAGLEETASEEAGSADGFQPVFAFDPATLELAPGSESTVTVTLRLPARTFTAGRDYRGEVQVIGGDGAVLDVTVRPRARSARSTRPASAAKTTKAAPKKAAPKKAAPRKAAPRKAAAKRPARAPRTPRQRG